MESNGLATIIADGKGIRFMMTYCAFCRRRQSYLWCSKCGKNICALCAWTVAVPPPKTNGVIDERCRPCAGVAW